VYARAAFIGALALLQPAPDTVFDIYQRGALIGTTAISVARDGDDWHLRGTGELKGDLQVTMPQLDIRYDSAWRPRIMTMEMVAKDDRAVVHVAFGLSDGTTRTDVVRSNNATWGSNKVSADTIPLPDLAFGAYEALAARLASAAPGQELRVFIAPRFETAMSVDGVVDEGVPTSGGALATKRWRATLRRPEGPSPMEIWVAAGRMVRLDLPKDGISVVRHDVIWSGGERIQ
jgi:hypothetical protein